MALPRVGAAERLPAAGDAANVPHLAAPGKAPPRALESRPTDDGADGAGAGGHDDPHAENVYLGRQPILNSSGWIVAYELLFRSSAINAAIVDDNTRATSHVVASMIGHFGIETVLGGHAGYINVNREVLLGELITVLPAHRFVLEVLESVEIDDVLRARCATLREAGFRIALDDVGSADTPNMRDLSAVDIVKVDFGIVDRSELQSIVALIRRRGRVPLAEKVETADDYRLALEHGFQLFQGYYFARPEVLSTRRLVSDRSALLALLGLLGREPEIKQIEGELKRIPKLIVQLLRYANSNGRTRRVSTLREATLAVGTRQIARWAQLMLYANDDVGLSIDADPVVQLVGTRARFMELAADHLKPMDDGFADEAFMTGVFSMAEAMFGEGGGDVLSELRLSPWVREAIEHRGGKLGALLDVAEAIESGDEAHIDQVCRDGGLLTGEAATRLAFDAVRWMTRNAQAS